VTTYKRLLIAVVAIAAIVACQHPSTTPAPTPQPTGGRGAAPGGVAAGTPRPRPPRLSPDSLGKLRRIMVNQVLATITGREAEPAGTVFKNVVFNKDIPAGQFVNMMDSSYARALGWQCQNCHVTTDFSSDAKKDKGRAKLMIEMTNVINSVHMPKLNAEKPEKVTCMLCHRGTNDPRDTVETYRMPAPRPPGSK
jgi:Photosynthetic reaction centre cytochrome C subunit